MAGESAACALRVAAQLAARGYAVTVGYWSDRDASPQSVGDSAHEALARLASLDGDRYLSLKAPALAFSARAVSKLLEASRVAGVGLHFDALAPDDVEPTFELIERGIEAGAPAAALGTTLPARFARSLADVERCIALGLSVRVVRGQWADRGSETGDVAGAFLAIVERLAGRARVVRVATHDPALAGPALQCLRVRGTRAELEVLWGPAARGVLRSGIARGARVRVYVPYGQAALPYALRDIAARPRMLAWLLRDIFVHDQLARFPALSV
jgi:proline dehydrogenase